MRDLKLRYFLELVSNIGAKSEADAKMVEAAQRRIKAEVTGTTEKVTALERAMDRLGASGSTERQISYMRRLGQAIDQNVARVRNLARAMAEAAPKATAIAGGAAGAFYASKALLDKPMDYDLRLSRMSNTAFSDRNVAGRVAGKQELNAAIQSAIQAGGGSRDDAAATLNDLISSGAMPISDAMKLLPVLMRGSSATGAKASQLGAIAVKGSQNMGIPLADMADVLGEANAAGKAGGFELENMAKDLPAAMAAGKQSGLTGRDGFRKIVAMMQASVITSGSKDEASRNVENLLGKINSVDTSNDFKKQGIDLNSELLKGRAHGMDSVDTFTTLVDRVASKDERYQTLKARLATEKDDGAKRETMSSMADILQGKAIGSVVQDKQALMALVAVMNNPAYMAEIQTKMKGGKDSMRDDYALISQTASFKADALANSRDSAMSRAFGDGGPINALMDGANWLAKEFPVLTSAVVATTAALGVMASALAAFGLLGGKGAGGLRLPGGLGGGPLGGGGSPGPFPILEGAAPAAAGSAVGAASVVGSVVAGGALLSAGSANMLRNNQAMRDAMQYDIGGDGAFAAAILNAASAPREPLPVNRRGQGYNDPRLLTLTSPGAADQAVTAGQPAKVELGQGEIRVVVEARGGLDVNTTVQRDMPGIRLNPGNTDPGRTRAGGPR